MKQNIFKKTAASQKSSPVVSLRAIINTIIRILTGIPVFVFVPVVIFVIYDILVRYDTFFSFSLPGVSAFSPLVSALIYSCVYGIVALVCFSYVVLACFMFLEKQTITFSILSQRIGKRFLGLLFMAITFFLLAGVGLVLFVIPGVLIGILLLFSFFEYIAREVNIYCAYKNSIQQSSLLGIFSTFFLVVGIFLLGSIFMSLKIRLLHIRIAPAAGINFYDLSLLSQSYVLAGEFVFSVIYYVFIFVTLTVLYYTVSTFFLRIPVSLRSSYAKRLSPMFTGLAAFFVVALVIVIVFFSLFTYYVQQYVVVMEPAFHSYAMISDSARERFSQVSSLLLTGKDKEGQEASSVYFLETDIDVLLTSFVPNVPGAAVDSRIDDSVISIEASIPLHALFDLQSPAYTNISVDFSFSKQGEIFVLYVYSGNVQSTGLFNDLLGETQFFWSHIVGSLQDFAYVAWDVDPRITYEILNRIETLEVKNGKILVGLQK